MCSVLFSSSHNILGVFLTAEAILVIAFNYNCCNSFKKKSHFFAKCKFELGKPNLTEHQQQLKKVLFVFFPFWIIILL
jgi:hypothetical protein